MKLSDTDIDEYLKLRSKYTGKDITIEEAITEARMLLSFIKSLSEE